METDEETAHATTVERAEDAPKPLTSAEAVAEMVQTAPMAVPEEKDPATALVLVAGALPADSKRVTIVVERRDAEGGALPGEAYPTGADAYFRSHTDTEFGVDPSARIFTLGDNLIQGGFGGLSRRKGVVHVGPASPIYGAINLAVLFGATDIQVAGATPEQQERLRPFIETLDRDKANPDAGIPADLAITFV